MMFIVLMLASGVFWTATYLLIIWQSFRDKTYGMPLVALGANLAWELIFSFIHPSPPIQRTVNIIWLSLDLVILLQLLRYGHREFPDWSRWMFYVACGLALSTSFGMVWLISAEFNDWTGTYTAFGQNLMMSVLFIGMLYHRRSLRGQSMGIAVCKLLGTACASLAFYLYTAISHRSVLLPFLYVTILIYDSIYVGLVYMQQRAAARAQVSVREPAEPRTLLS